MKIPYMEQVVAVQLTGKDEGRLANCYFPPILVPQIYVTVGFIELYLLSFSLMTIDFTIHRFLFLIEIPGETSIFITFVV